MENEIDATTSSIREEEKTVNEECEEEEEGKGNDNVVDVGFLVDKINTKPYLTAIERGEVPFCAFSPVSTEDLFLLRIQECSDTTRHMLVPANKEEVFNTPGALKEVDELPDRDDVYNNLKVAVVAIARQVYSEEQKQLLVSVDPISKKDKHRVTCVKFLTLDKFADFAFAGFDGNVSEFAKKSKNEDRSGSGSSKQDHGQNDGDDVVCQPSVASERTPLNPPSRRGRGGRRGGGRGRKLHSSSRDSPTIMRRGYRGRGGGSFGDHGLAHAQQKPIPMMQQVIFQPSFQPSSSFVPNDCNHPFIKMENMSQRQMEGQFFTEVQIPISQQMTMPLDQMQFASGEDLGMFFEVPMTLPSDVPMPFREVTIGQTGSEADGPQPNHDIFTIAIDQLLSLTGDPETDAALFGTAVALPPDYHQPERGTTTSSRGGRRPGRKPGRKPGVGNDRQELKDNSNCAFGIMGTDVGVKTDKPKRRGRPPKNKVVEPVKVVAPENENSSSIDGEEFNKANHFKLPIFGDQ